MRHLSHFLPLYRVTDPASIRVLALPILLVVCLHIAGCATIVNGPEQVIPITSAPSQAKLIVDGSAHYTTPCSVSLKRKTGHTLVFQKPGYEDLTYQIHTKTSAAIAGNILLGGLIGLGVDAATGASNDLVPASVNVTLTPLESSQVMLSQATQPADVVMPTEPCDMSALPSVPIMDQASIAVLDFLVGLEEQKESGRAIGDICRDVVQRSRQFILLDRENMRSILGEQDFAAAVQCDETKCLVEYGKLLSVQKMLHGRISLLGSSYVVYLSLTDVETGRIESTVTAQAERSLDALGRLMPTLVCNLLKDTLSEENATSASAEVD